MKEKKHGLTGKPSNNNPENPKTSRVVIAVTPAQKAEWVRAANDLGVNLSTWITGKLNGNVD